MKERATLAAKTDKFWYTAIMNCGSSAQFVDPVDHDVLQHLDDVWIEHEADPRNWEITFTFNKKNPYFDETKLSKKFTVVPPTGSEAEQPTEFDLEADLFLSGEQKISWTSNDHNLVKKAPKVSHSHAHGGGCCGGHGADHQSGEQVNIQDLEENDEFSGPGTFFNIFAQTGEDDEGLGEFLLEWWAHALEYAAGLQPEEDSDEDYDEFDEDSELEGSVDLESEEEEKPAKKKAKK